jgi:hypothetical protein
LESAVYGARCLPVLYSAYKPLYSAQSWARILSWAADSRQYIARRNQPQYHNLQFGRNLLLEIGHYQMLGTSCNVHFANPIVGGVLIMGFFSTKPDNSRISWGLAIASIVLMCVFIGIYLDAYSAREANLLTIPGGAVPIFVGLSVLVFVAAIIGVVAAFRSTDTSNRMACLLITLSNLISGIMLVLAVNTA